MSETSINEEPMIDQGIGTGTGSRSFEAESWMFTQHKNYHLQLVQKKEPPIYRSSIPATTLQRLAYFRNFVSFIGKTQIFSIQTINVNKFLWNAFITAIFKSFPSNFRVLFLSSYSPEEHCYVSKMVPILYGATIQNMVSALVDLIMTSESLVLLLEYFILGAYQKNPWNTCDNATIRYKKRVINCYSLEDFLSKYKNQTLSMKKTLYIDNNINGTERFVQLAPILYYTIHKAYLGIFFAETHYIIYVIIIWLGAVLAHRQIFKKYIWRILELTHNAVMIIYLCTFAYLISVFVEEDWTPPDIPDYFKKISKSLEFIDFVFLAEAIFSPPVVHIVSARSPAHIEPGMDSAILTMSNMIFLVLRGLLAFKLKVYCEKMVRHPIVGSLYNRYPWFTLWPIFFTQMPFGSLMLLIFYFVHFVSDWMTFIITFQCIVEMTVCEWAFLKRWLVGIVLGLIGFLPNIFSNTTQRIIFYIFVKSTMIITEIVVVNFLYPLERLIDDITFHYGHPPTITRWWSLKMVPYFYGVKMYLLIRAFHDLFKTNLNYYTYQAWSIAICTAPILFGMIYAIYKFLIIRKQNWRVLFRPRPNWGPREHITRQLRKQYDAREHIISMGSRYLSRHLMAKSGMKTYRLDIRYDADRRSTVPGVLPVK